MIKNYIKRIEEGIKDNEKTINGVNKDFNEDQLIAMFENLVYYALFEKIETSDISKEDFEKMYEVFISDEEYDKCAVIQDKLNSLQNG